MRSTHLYYKLFEVIKGGDLDRLLSGSKGVALVNSTVALHAMRLDVPVCVLGDAIFDAPGLSHQAGVDAFWQNPDPVNPDAFDRFTRALSRIQVKGSFYNADGRVAAIDEICRRLGNTSDPLDIASGSPPGTSGAAP